MFNGRVFDGIWAMLWMSRLDRHQEACERNAERTQRTLENLSDKMDRTVERLEAKLDDRRREMDDKISDLHRQNQASIKELAATTESGFTRVWTTLKWMVGGVISILVMMLWFMLTHGGVAAFLK